MNFPAEFDKLAEGVHVADGSCLLGLMFLKSFAARLDAMRIGAGEASGISLCAHG